MNCVCKPQPIVKYYTKGMEISQNYPEINKAEFVSKKFQNLMNLNSRIMKKISDYIAVWLKNAILWPLRISHVHCVTQL